MRLYGIYNRLPKCIKQTYRYLKQKFFGKDGQNSRSYSQKSFFESAFYQDVEFISFEHLIFLCDQWIPRIDRNFDVIVGVPRSGLLVANILALKLGKPLTVPELVTSAWCSKSIQVEKKENQRFLLVDDSYQTGESMEKAVQQLLQSGISRDQIKTAALITSKNGVDRLDSYGIELTKRRVFEWNLAHKKMDVVSDLDGVLCVDPPAITFDNEEEYAVWIKNAKPLFIPTFKINTILTSRIEKYRADTESWLQQNGVKYNNLIMSPELSRAAQKMKGPLHKIEYLRTASHQIYWESSEKEAKQLKECKIKIPILIISTKRII